MFERIIFGIFVSMVIWALDNNALAQNLEVVCRAKAKDVAVQMYQSCVTEARNKRIEEIRKEYQHKLAGLKKYYDSELKKMGSGAAAAKAKNSESGVSEESAPVSQPRVSKTKTVEIPPPEVQGSDSEGSENNVETVNVQEI